MEHVCACCQRGMMVSSQDTPSLFTHIQNQHQQMLTEGCTVLN